MSLVLIYNPVCGDSTAEQFFTDYVIPRLYTANRIPTEIIRTSADGSEVGRQLLDILNRYNGDVTVVLGSGDGTLHEIVNHLVFATDANQLFPVRFVLVPCGTANALYASLFRSRAQDTTTYKLLSLEAFLAASTPRRLTLSLTSLLGPLKSQRGQHGPQPTASIVVTSTALHAAILKDSEKLRKEMPGIERFKVAAQQNITKWYAGHVRLLPIPSSGVIYTYDPQHGDLVPLDDPDATHSALDIHGPFAYFLSTVNVDRLEPEFRTNPMISKNPPVDASMDIVILRPERDPTFITDTSQEREKFAKKVVAVLTAAYQDGIHINLRYHDNGDIAESGCGKTVIEYFRCGGWEWIPDESDEDAHFLCADGTIFKIEQGGRAICRVGQPTDVTLRNFYVHA